MNVSSVCVFLTVLARPASERARYEQRRAPDCSCCEAPHKAGMPVGSCAFPAVATSEGTYEARNRLTVCPTFTGRPSHEHEGTEFHRRNACRGFLRGWRIGPGRHHFARLRLCVRLRLRAGLRLCLCDPGLWGA